MQTNATMRYCHTFTRGIKSEKLDWAKHSPKHGGAADVLSLLVDTFSRERETEEAERQRQSERDHSTKLPSLLWGQT